MKIIINDKRKIFSIQEDFNALFPYLRLEFFSKQHKEGEASAKKHLKEHNKTIAECRTVHYAGEMSIIPTMTVAELENSFKNIFGLSTQVFRKSGKVWLETTVTDSWTLEEQNKQGEALSAHQ